MSWQDYDEDGVPLWNEALSPEVKEAMERDWHFRMERAKHEMPAKDFPKDNEVKSDTDNSMFSRVTNYLKSFVVRK